MADGESPTDFADVSGKRVLLRADLNVPMRDGRVASNARLRAIIPTVRALSARGARVVLMSHFGRPRGGPDERFSLAPVAAALGDLLGRPVRLIPACVGPIAEKAVAVLAPGDVATLENLRFHPEESENDPAFAAALARLGDVYVNDAFSVAHRRHASTVGVAGLLPARAGPAMLREIAALGAALETPARPVGAVVGGAKVSTKLGVLGNLVGRMDWIAVGGGMANTFLRAVGVDVGASLCERDMAGQARDILGRARDSGCDILLPVDAVTAKALEENAPHATRTIADLRPDEMILDIGPASAAALKARADGCRTLLWNGPLGAFETPPFHTGTADVARHVAARTRAGKLTSVAGGGDTMAALALAGVSADFTHVSTAGGAFLEWLEGRALPAVAALGLDSGAGRAAVDRTHVDGAHVDHVDGAYLDGVRAGHAIHTALSGAGQRMGERA